MNPEHWIYLIIVASQTANICRNLDNYFACTNNHTAKEPSPLCIIISVCIHIPDRLKTLLVCLFAQLMTLCANEFLHEMSHLAFLLLQTNSIDQSPGVIVIILSRNKLHQRYVQIKNVDGLKINFNWYKWEAANLSKQFCIVKR